MKDREQDMETSTQRAPLGKSQNRTGNMAEEYPAPCARLTRTGHGNSSASEIRNASLFPAWQDDGTPSLRNRRANGLLCFAALALAISFLTGCFEDKNSSAPAQSSPTMATATPPPPPKGFQALAASPTEVILEWEKPTTGVTHLSLERKGGANTDFVTVVEKLPADQIDYLDEVQPETEYTYRLFAWAGELRSNEPAGPVTVKTPPYPPQPPAWIRAEAQGPRRVALSWGEAAGAKKFTVLRADEKTREFLSLGTVENKQVFTDEEVAPATRYWYKIRAANDNPETTESKVVSVTTPAEGETPATPPQPEEVTPPPTPRPRPLAQPNIVEAVVDVEGVLLRWEPAARNASYAILRTMDLGMPFVTLDVVDNVTNYIDRRVVPGRSYYYKIRAYAPDGRTAESQVIRLDLDVPGSVPVVVGPPPEVVPVPGPGGIIIDVSIPPLEPPRRLEVRQPAPDRVELRWRGGEGASRFYILRSERGGRHFDIIDSVRDRNSYVDRDIRPDTQYWYRVRATNRLGMVADSEVVSIRTQASPAPAPTPAPPSPPRSVEARALSASEIEIRWSDAPGATSFMVLRAAARSGEYYPLERVRDRWSYVDRGLQADTTYWYKVRAMNDGPAFAESAPVSAKTLPAATPSPSPSPTPTATPRPSPTPTPTATPTPTETPHPSPTPSPEPTATPTPSPTPTVTPEPSPTATPAPSPSVTPEPSPSPTATPEPTPTRTPRPRPPLPTVTPEPSPTATPAPSPSVTPEPSPSPTATPEPTPTRTPRPRPPLPTVTPEPTIEPPATPTYTPEPTPTRTPRPRPTRPPRIETPRPIFLPETPEPLTPTPGLTIEVTPSDETQETPRRVLPTRGPFLTPKAGERPRVPWATATPVPGKGLPTIRERFTPPAEKSAPREELATRQTLAPESSGAETTPASATEQRSPDRLDRRGLIQRLREQRRAPRATPPPSEPQATEAPVATPAEASQNTNTQ
jgi:hypothetical protein